MKRRSRENDFADIMIKLQKRRFLHKYKRFITSCRREDFLLRIKNYHYRSRELRAVRKAFEKMKVNSLSAEVQAYTQDKF